MAETTGAPISAEDAASQKDHETWKKQHQKYTEDLKKKYPDLNVDPDPNFLSGTREEQLERMAKHVAEVAKATGQPEPNHPMPGQSEPWWKSFINFEVDLKETVDEKTRKELEKITKVMYDEGLTPEAIAKGRETGEKLLAPYLTIVERAKTFLYNEEGLGKIRETILKFEAEGKPSPFPYPLGKGKKADEEEVVESLD